MRVPLILAALFLMGNNDLPPVKYQVNAPPSVIVIIDNPNSDGTCGKAPPGWVTRACEFSRKGQAPLLLMPNPCFFPEAQDDMSYAHLLCHELGHASGWNAAHNN